MLSAAIKKNPRKMIPIAMMLVVVGLTLVTTGNLVARHWAAAGLPSSQWGDFTFGFMVGLGIILEIFGLVIAAKAASEQRKQKKL